MIRRWLIVAALLWMAGSAVAHQAKEATTRVLFNERTGNVEVMHRFLVHDAEHAVREVFGADADILGSAATRQRFAEYVSKRFSIRDQDGRTLPLESVGQEIDGKFLWVYVETPIPTEIESLTITHDALRDLWPDQVNLVNVDRGDDAASALFADGTSSITIALGADDDATR